MYSIGQLASLAGITIKTLHYYEQLGLLQPQRNEKNGYRVYHNVDIMKLQEITLLKEMGFLLSEIKEIIGAGTSRLERDKAAEMDKEHIWKAAIARQLEALQVKQEKLQKVETLLKTAQYSIEVTGIIHVEDIMRFVKELDAQALSSREQYRSKHFREEELAQLPSLEHDDPLALEWAGLLNDINNHVTESADSPASRRLAAQIIAMSNRMFSDNEELIAKYWEFIRPRNDGTPSLYGMSNEVMNYIERILERYNQNCGQ
ncbi:MerR family transcriptional regulator [Paenibacillaceae bacterium]|nr:MerR family transcriptional regulator [Paenibacillaceae bacterium]